MVPACPLPGEGSGLLMEGFSTPKNGVEMSQPTLGPAFHHLTHNLWPSQAGLASSQHSLDFPLDATKVVFSHTNS